MYVWSSIFQYYCLILYRYSDSIPGIVQQILTIVSLHIWVDGVWIMAIVYYSRWYYRIAFLEVIYILVHVQPWDCTNIYETLIAQYSRIITTTTPWISPEARNKYSDRLAVNGARASLPSCFLGLHKVCYSITMGLCVTDISVLQWIFVKFRASFLFSLFLFFIWFFPVSLATVHSLKN